MASNAERMDRQARQVAAWNRERRLETQRDALLEALEDVIIVLSDGMILQQREDGQPTQRAERELIRIEAVVSAAITTVKKTHESL